MIVGKKEFYGGLGLLVGFLIILVVIFSPVFNGKNGLEYLDNLYNSISKGSAYYIPKVKKEADTLKGSHVNLIFNMHDKKRARDVATQFKKHSINVKVSDKKIRVSGDLGTIMDLILTDA
ncbi:hypothetical protein ACFLZL_04610, partial [Thermodesulfobacteriota bacterium]